jgi:hypothetical protein
LEKWSQRQVPRRCPGDRSLPVSKSIIRGRDRFINFYQFFASRKIAVLGLEAALKTASSEHEQIQLLWRTMAEFKAAQEPRSEQILQL